MAFGILPVFFWGLEVNQDFESFNNVTSWLLLGQNWTFSINCDTFFRFTQISIKVACQLSRGGDLDYLRQMKPLLKGLWSFSEILIIQNAMSMAVRPDLGLEKSHFFAIVFVLMVLITFSWFKASHLLESELEPFTESTILERTNAADAEEFSQVSTFWTLLNSWHNIYLGS